MIAYMCTHTELHVQHVQHVHIQLHSVNTHVQVKLEYIYTCTNKDMTLKHVNVKYNIINYSNQALKTD